MAFAEISIRDTATLTSDVPPERLARAKAARSLLADVAEYWHRWNLVVSRKIRVAVSLEDRLASAHAAPDADVVLAPTRRRRGQRSVMMMPDPYFITSRGHARLRQCVAEHDCAWAAKADGAYWRGSTTGHADPARNRRIAFWRAHRDEADLALTRLDHRRHRGLPVSPKTPVAEHLRHRYQVDLEGHSCSWDGLFWKLLSNSTVLRVEQPDEQWYHRRLRPWVHYVPCTVATFPRRLAWCRAHPEACARMAEAATALAASLTYEAEAEHFARSLARRLGLRSRRCFGRERRARRMLEDLLAEMAEKNEHGRIAKPP